MYFFLNDFFMFKYKINVFDRYEQLFFSKTGTGFIYQLKAVWLRTVYHHLLAACIQQLFDVFKPPDIAAAARRDFNQAVQLPDCRQILFMLPVPG